jgi:hypothetical protein
MEQHGKTLTRGARGHICGLVTDSVLQEEAGDN